MVKTASTMLPLGTKAPDFSLINVDGRTVSLADFKSSRALLIVFMCNHCPFVKHIADELAAIARDYMPQGVGMVGINSNDTSKHPEDSPEQMVHEAEMRGYMFPYLFDEEQEVAQAYKAACTPDFFLFDEDQTLVYRGQGGQQPTGQRNRRDGQRSAPRSTPYWPTAPSPIRKCPASVATSNGGSGSRAGVFQSVRRELNVLDAQNRVQHGKPKAAMNRRTPNLECWALSQLSLANRDDSSRDDSQSR
ncbi:MAG: thioredoxin family protein [Pirellulaceae bacterium]